MSNSDKEMADVFDKWKKDGPEEFESITLKNGMVIECSRSKDDGSWTGNCPPGWKQKDADSDEGDPCHFFFYDSRDELIDMMNQYMVPCDCDECKEGLDEIWEDKLSQFPHAPEQS